jgi:polyhydroxyalkanoate synthesis regulator phasin
VATTEPPSQVNVPVSSEESVAGIPDLSQEAQQRRLADAIRIDQQQLVPQQAPVRSGDRMTDAPTQPRPNEAAAREYVTDVYNKQNDVNERNPVVTGGKMLWNTISNDLPAALYGTLASGAFMGDDTRGIYLTEESRKAAGELRKETDKLRQEGQKFAAKEGLAYQEASAKFTDDLVKSISQVKDPLDGLNYVFGVIGQTTAQIPMSVGTGGASSIMQEVGPIYLGGVQKIAQEKRLTIDQVMDQNLDEPLFAATYGTIAGLLDRFGAGKVMGSFGKEALKKSIRARAKEVAISGGLVEPLTEYAQTALEQLGEEQTAGRGFTESVKDVMSDPAKSKERVEALVAGLVGGVGLGAIGSAIPKTNDNTSATAQRPPAGDADVQRDGESTVLSTTTDASTAPIQPEQPIVNQEQQTQDAVQQDTEAIPAQASVAQEVPFVEDQGLQNTQNREGEVAETPNPQASEERRQDQGNEGQQELLSPAEEQQPSVETTPSAEEPAPQQTEFGYQPGDIAAGTEVQFYWPGFGRDITGKVVGYKNGRIKMKGKDGIIYTKDPKDVKQLTPEVKSARPRSDEKIVAYNSKKKKPIGIVSNGKTGPDFFGFQIDLPKVTAAAKKLFTSKGFLPQEVFNRWIKTKGEIGKYESQIRFTLGDIKKAIKEEYGGKKPTDDQITDLNLALSGKQPMNPIPPKTLSLIEDMRAQVDNISHRFIDEGVIAGDLSATFTKNLGTYLTRSYRKFDDPFWSEFVPDEVRNKAEGFIRDSSKFDAQKYFARAEKVRQALGKKDARIQEIKDRITKIKDTFTGDKSGYLSPEKARELMEERDETLSRIGDRISALEKQLSEYPERADYLEGEALGMLDNAEYYNFLEATEDAELEAQDLLSQATKLRDKVDKIPGLIEKLRSKAKEIKSSFTGDHSGKLTLDQARDLIDDMQKKVSYLQKKIEKIETRDYQGEIDTLTKIGQEKYNITNDEIQGLIDYLLYSPEAPGALLKGSKLGSKDLSVLKKRDEIAPEIRALYGEYSDPLLNYARTITKMANLVAKHHFLQDVRSEGMNNFLFEKPVGKFSAKIAAEGSKTMAPLNGLYTTKEIAQAFEEFNAMEPMPGWIKAYMKVNAYIKAGKTVFSIMTHARNIFGNFGFVVMNAHYRADKAGKAIQTAFANVYSNADWKKIREKFKEYIELGVVQDSGAAGELRNYLEDIKKGEDFFEKINDNKIKKIRNAVLDTTQNMYQFEDDLFKIYAYENEYARYKKAFPDMDDQQVKDKAAEIVRNTYPTYSMVPKIVKAFRANPLVGTFVSFPAEVLRTTYNTIALAKEEMANPSTRSIGAQRTAGIMAAALLPTAASYATMALLGLDGQDDEDLRKFVAPWQKNSEYLYMGVDGDKYRIIDMGYSDPHSYLKRPVYDLLKGGDLERSVIESVSSLAEPFLTEELLAERLIDWARNQKKTGDHVYNPDAPLGDKAADTWHHMQVAVEPGTVASLRRILKAAEGDTDKYGNKYELTNELVGLVSGQKQEVKDVSQALLFRAYELKDRADLTEKELSRVRYNKTATPEDLADAQRKHDAAMDVISQDALDIYYAAIRLGVDPKEAKKTLYRTKSAVIVKKIKQ